MSTSTSISCIPVHMAKRFIKECITAAGASAVHAADMADVLVMADHRGHFSHGLNRLGNYQFSFIVIVYVQLRQTNGFEFHKNAKH